MVLGEWNRSLLVEITKPIGFLVDITWYNDLVWLAVWNMAFMTFHSVGNNHSNWQAHIFPRGRAQPPTSRAQRPEWVHHLWETQRGTSCGQVSLCTDTNVRPHTDMHVDTHTQIYIYIYIFVYVYVYISMYIYMHIYWWQICVCHSQRSFDHPIPLQETAEKQCTELRSLSSRLQDQLKQLRHLDLKGHQAPWSRDQTSERPERGRKHNMEPRWKIVNGETRDDGKHYGRYGRYGRYVQLYQLSLWTMEKTMEDMVTSANNGCMLMIFWMYQSLCFVYKPHEV